MRLLLLLFPLLCTADPCLNPLSLTCWEYRMGMGRMWGMDIGTNPPHTCTGSHICYKVPNTTDPCNALKSKRVLFCGDSYVRHAYEGLVLLLSGDYETGAIKNDPACAGEALFGEKDCQLKVPPHFEICGVRIELRYNAQLNIDDHVYDWVVWGTQTEEPLDHLCTSVAKFSAKIIILNNHHVLHAQQRNEQIQHLNDKAHGYLRHRCNITRLVDTFAMTSELSRAEPNPGKLTTHDGVHWGRMVNVVKAWMLVAAMD
jgi:hypothetical protein